MYKEGGARTTKRQNVNYGRERRGGGEGEEKENESREEGVGRGNILELTQIS